MLRVVVFGALVAGAIAGSTTISQSSFDDIVINSGKSSIVKFYAPWCGHCKAMAPAWEELGTEYESSSSVVIGNVDCTVESALCQTYGVNGYPTLKYFNAGDKEAKDYNGGRDKESLKKFVQDNLEVKCDVSSTDGCTDKEIAYIESMKGKSSDDRKAQIQRLDKMKGDKMKPELKQWVMQRLQILKALEA